MGGSKTNIPRIRNKDFRGQTSPNHPIHLAMCHISRIWPFQRPDWSWRSALPQYGDSHCCFWRPELPNVNFAGSVQTGLAEPCSGCLTRPLPLACLLGFLCWGKRVRAEGRWQAAKSMCEQSVQPGYSRRVCVRVYVCVCLWGLRLYLRGWGGHAIPFHVAPPISCVKLCTLPVKIFWQEISV